MRGSGNCPVALRYRAQIVCGVSLTFGVPKYHRWPVGFGRRSPPHYCADYQPQGNCAESECFQFRQYQTFAVPSERDSRRHQHLIGDDAPETTAPAR